MKKTKNNNEDIKVIPLPHLTENIDIKDNKLLAKWAVKVLTEIEEDLRKTLGSEG